MPGSHGALCINSFYPETELNITEIQEYEKQILIRMKSISKDCRCPKCGCITDKYHGTYIRKVQDLPILGKRVQLEICSHEYECINDGCEVTTFAEIFDGFLNTYSRMTERCADFICSNGFVEGTNSRLKMIKRTMYGRCRKQLLEAKLRYVGNFKNG